MTADPLASLLGFAYWIGPALVDPTDSAGPIRPPDGLILDYSRVGAAGRIYECRTADPSAVVTVGPWPRWGGTEPGNMDAARLAYQGGHEFVLGPGGEAVYA